MIQEVIATGRDVNAAIDNGCRELGIVREEDSFDFEIIAMERKGFLGLKTYPAKVRVFREVPDPKPVPPVPEKQAERKPEKQPEKPSERPKKEAAPAKDRPAPAGETKEPSKEAKEKGEAQPSQEPRREPKEKPRREKKPKEQKERPRREREAPQEASSGERPSQIEVEPTDNVRERVERSAAYVEKLLTLMGIGDVKVTPRYYEDNVCLQLTGTGLGVIIGRRGETLDAVQYLSSLVANRGEGDYIRINIDSGNYREKRERTLEALARKLANQAVRTGKSTTLEPMNPYERRVIHGAVAQVKGATSSSIGVDPNRRVVISAVDAPAGRYEEGGRGGRGRDRRRDDHRREGGRGRREDRRGGRPPRSGSRYEETAEVRPPRPKLDDGPAPERTYSPKPAEPAAPPPKLVEFTPEEREATEKTSLYGKIEL